MGKDITIIIVGVALAALVWTMWGSFQAWRTEVFGEPEPVACTLEAKLCPDGSFVGRTGPTCTFEPCPGE